VQISGRYSSSSPRRCGTIMQKGSCNAKVTLVPAPVSRSWMDATVERYAYRCLPLLIANQAGWFVLNSHELRATWNGEEGLSGGVPGWVNFQFIVNVATAQSVSTIPSRAWAPCFGQFGGPRASRLWPGGVRNR
jgi:hypothetical protein